jgi:hypothetical protein
MSEVLRAQAPGYPSRLNEQDWPPDEEMINLLDSWEGCAIPFPKAWPVRRTGAITQKRG